MAKSDVPGRACSSHLQGTPDENVRRHPAAYSPPETVKICLETVVYHRCD
ncbi:hypothetical protein ACLK1T_17315 [Escherichia coli]